MARSTLTISRRSGATSRCPSTASQSSRISCLVPGLTLVLRLGPDVPQWFGETIGFWDGEALITWTSNIQGWISHGGFEFSNRQ